MKKLYEEEDIRMIAEHLRLYGDSGKTYTVKQMPEGIETVSGIANSFGYKDGHADGVTDGKKAERDAFWDVFQENGTRTNYSNAFNSAYWNHLTFKPTYDFKPVGDARNMFAQFGTVKDFPKMTKILSDAGVALDTSLVTNARMMFYTCRVSDVPPLDLTSATDIYCLFYDAMRIETIEITLAPNKVTNAQGMFSSCQSLTNLTVHGVIDVNGISLQWSTGLTKDSFYSVIRALSDETSGLSITFSQAAKEAAFTDTEWAALIAEKPNWTIALV